MSMFNVKPESLIDAYKFDHRRQYPDGTTEVYSNFTPRNNQYLQAQMRNVTYDGKVVAVGTQMVMRAIHDVWDNEFFKQDKQKVCKRYARRLTTSLGPNDIGVEHLAALHDLGFLPIEVKALPEGCVIDTKIPMFTIRNTIPEFFWLVNYLETLLSCMSWKIATSATIARQYRKILEDAAKKTGSSVEFVDWQAHDFSFRGMSGVDDAILSGVGHLTSFTGTDTVPAIDAVEDYYGDDAEMYLIGGSVAATEHSVMCMGGKDSEIETFNRLLNLYPTGIVSVVSDTWDFWNVVTNTVSNLKDNIMARDGKLVIRPDSGDPVKIICGEKVIPAISIDEAVEHLMYTTEWKEGEAFGPMRVTNIFTIQGKVYKITVTPEWDRHDKRFYYIDDWKEPKVEEITLTPEQKGAIECLWDVFGGTETLTGHKVLDSHIGLIYGDSITMERAKEITDRLAEKGFASCNVVFGVGSYTYEYQTRDTLGFAMKATYGVVNGQSRELFKDPITDSGTKKSAKGLLRVEKVGNEYELHDQQSVDEELGGELKTVYLNGVFFNKTTMEQIRNRLKAQN